MAATKADRTSLLVLIGALLLALGVGITIGDAARKFIAKVESDRLWTICSSAKPCDCSCRCVVETPPFDHEFPEYRDAPDRTYEPYEY